MRVQRAPNNEYKYFCRCERLNPTVLQQDAWLCVFLIDCVRLRGVSRVACIVLRIVTPRPGVRLHEVDRLYVCV